MEDKSVIELTEVTSNFVIKDNNSPSESSTRNPNQKNNGSFFKKHKSLQ